MAYAHSAARKTSINRSNNLKKVFTFAKKRTKQLPTYIRDSIFQNCIFQLSAILEDYLYDLTSTWISRVKEETAGNSLIPYETRILLISKAQEGIFKKYLYNEDEVELTKSISDMRMFFEMLDNQQKFREYEAAIGLIKEKKFPSPRNVDALFRRMGLPKITKNISRRTRSDFILSLQGFMDIRNALAHESPPSITDEDVARHFDNILRWINAFDREFYRHVVRCSGASHW